MKLRAANLTHRSFTPTMFLLPLSLALAGLVQASSAAVSSQSQSPHSSAVQSTSQLKLPLYPPYPISSTATTNATASASASTSASVSASASAKSSSVKSSSVSSYQSDKYWQHTYRDYYASIITVLSTSTLVYQIDCAPNSAHPSYRQPDFQSFDVCAARIVGRGPMTVTQGPDQWNFVVSSTEAALNLTDTRYGATTSTILDVTCNALQEKTKTCSNLDVLETDAPSPSAVAAPSFPSGWSTRSTTISVGDGGESVQRESQVESLLENFSTMTEVLVTVTGGWDKLAPSGTFLFSITLLRWLLIQI